MATAAVPTDICLEIARFSSRREIVLLSRLTRAAAYQLRPLLYTEIKVAARHANSLVATLATWEELPPLVKCLVFEPGHVPDIDDTNWGIVLAGMSALHTLAVATHIPLDWRFLPSITFRLRSFTSVNSVIGAWASLVTAQPELIELIVMGDFFAPIPPANVLPALRHLDQRRTPEIKTRDIMRFTRSPAQLDTIRLMASQVLTLLRYAPRMLTTVKHLVLDEDRNWRDTGCQEGTSLVLAAESMSMGNFPLLESCRLVCSVVTSIGWMLPCIKRSDSSHPFNSLYWNWGSRLRLCAKVVAELQITAAETASGSLWPTFLCPICIVLKHTEQPCHTIETWNGEYIVRRSLKALGLRVQFGHGAHGQCPNAVPDDHFTIIDGKGRHEVAINYCGCPQARSRNEQFREALLMPMGTQTAATPHAVELYRMLKRKHSVSHADSQCPIPCPPVVPTLPTNEGKNSELMEVDGTKTEEMAPVDLWHPAWDAAFNALTQSVTENPTNVFGNIDAEPAERAWWEGNQWVNVLNIATHAMRPGERRDMLGEEAFQYSLRSNPVSWRATDAMDDTFLYDHQRSILRLRMASMLPGSIELSRTQARIRRLTCRIREAVDRYRAASYDASLETPGPPRDWDVMEKRTCSAIPDPQRLRINPWVTQFTPPNNEGLRRGRAHSLPLGVEATKREEAAKREKVDSLWEPTWNAAFKETFAYLKHDTRVYSVPVIRTDGETQAGQLINPIRWRAAEAFADMEHYQHERNNLLLGLQQTNRTVRARARARERVDRLGIWIREAAELYREATYLARLEDFARAPVLDGFEYIN
ncbi:hypothetical protein FB451DRAFT_1399020 [Mycena latifolia]|nr:hypothetical protein FB451DRAFT_1399020 [Mycena latifolia]